MSRTLLIGALVAIVALAVGCTQPRTVVPDPTRDVALDEALAAYAYAKSEMKVTTELTESTPLYDVIRVAYASYDAQDVFNPTTVAWYYRQKGQHRQAGIVQIPILGGDYGPSKLFAETYASQGFHVLRFERKDQLFDVTAGMARTRQTIIDTIIDMRRGLDWWLAQPEVDASRVGVCGISMGGFMGSLLLAVDDRVSTGVLMLNGGDFPRLIVRSKEEYVVGVRDAFMRMKGWSEAQVLAEGEKDLGGVDPLVVAPRLNPNRILFVSPRFDQVVPFDLAQEWWEAAGRPRRIIIPTGHYSSVFFLFYIQGVAVDHFRTQFGLETPAPERWRRPHTMAPERRH